MRLRGAGSGLRPPWRYGRARETVADAYVVDTGMFPRWFIDQDGFEHAGGLQQKLIEGAATDVNR